MTERKRFDGVEPEWTRDDAGSPISPTGRRIIDPGVVRPQVKAALDRLKFAVRTKAISDPFDYKEQSALSARISDLEVDILYGLGLEVDE